MLYGPRGILSLARARERKDGERGQILVLFTLVLVVLMVCAAIVIDVGLLRTDSARLQNALDAGALAAAQSLPATSANVGAVKLVAANYAADNYPGVATPDTTFRCIIGADASGNPTLIDMPTVCNVPVGSTWVCTAALCWAPCDPVARSTDVCNTVVLKDSAVQPYTFGRVVGINGRSTGTLQAAACTGPCGPTNPVDVVLTIDRTLSMQGLESTLVDGAHAVLEAYDPDIQHVALGMIGPSTQLSTCSTGAHGKILTAQTTPAIGGSSTADVQSAGNATGGAATLVINKPTSTSAGDLLVAGITFNGGSGVTVTPPTGWTPILRTDNGTNVGMASYYKVAGTSETGPYTWTLGAATVRASGGILLYSNVDTGNPIDVSAGGSGNDITAPFQVTAPTVTTTKAQTAIVGFYGIATGTTYSANSALTERFDARNPNAVGPSTQGATGTRATAGSSGTDYATAGAGGQWVAQHIAVNSVPMEAFSMGYPTSTPAYSDASLAANMAKWIPVGLTGTQNADVLQSYRNADGTVNASSTIAKTIGCVLPPNDLYQGTDQASPFDFATAYLMGTSASPRHARPQVTTGIIFETDGTPQTQNYTCQQAQTAAATAKAKGIEVFTIGFFASNQAGSLCPDSSGTWHNKTVVQSLAAMATNSATVRTTSCDANENTDNDHFFCVPAAGQLAAAFRSAALALSGGSRLVQLYPQPAVTSVAPSSNGAAGMGVAITGRFFTEAYSVTFGGVAATRFTVVSDTLINAVAPAHTNGTVDIQVSTPGGSSNITGNDHFTYGP